MDAFLLVRKQTFEVSGNHPVGGGRRGGLLKQGGVET